METYIPISQINDFIFCPRSIYYHQLYQNYDSTLYYKQSQVDGKAAHHSIDQKKYSTRKDILQGIPVYSEALGLGGKIDIYNQTTKVLIERKKKVVRIYDGYIYQVYAQWYALKEMHYEVEEIFIYSLDDNKKYPISLPEEDEEMHRKFLDTIEKMKNYDLHKPFEISVKKCNECIYRELCDIP